MSVARAAQLVEAGLWLKLSGDGEGARKLFEQALRLDPQNAKARQLIKEVGVATPRAMTPVQNAFALPAPPEPAAPSYASGWEAKAGPEQQVEVQHEPDDAMGLLSTETRLTPAPGLRLGDEMEALLKGVDDLLALDDHSNALEVLQKADLLAPGHPEVERRRKRSEAVLESMLQSRLGPVAGVPRRKLKDDEIIWLNLDHRAGFVLAQIDGTVSFDDLFALSGMSRLDTAKILVQLMDEGAIEVGELIA
jgi:hypothetical protein